jgi:hypothetical protein
VVQFIGVHEGLRHLAHEVGATQIVMGTDHPFGWTKTAVDHILGATAAILGADAAWLDLGIFGRRRL